MGLNGWHKSSSALNNYETRLTFPIVKHQWLRLLQSTTPKQRADQNFAELAIISAQYPIADGISTSNIGRLYITAVDSTRSTMDDYWDFWWIYKPIGSRECGSRAFGSSLPKCAATGSSTKDQLQREESGFKTNAESRSCCEEILSKPRNFWHWCLYPLRYLRCFLRTNSRNRRRTWLKCWFRCILAVREEQVGTSLRSTRQLI